MRKAIETIYVAMVGKARLFGGRATGRNLKTVSWRNRIGIAAGLCILFIATRAHAVPGTYFTHFISGAVTEDHKLTASDGAANDNFGGSVSISGDYAVVGAKGDDDSGNGSGSAYIFERAAGGAWLQTPKLTASVGAEWDYFGESVSISGDYAVVGASGNDDNGDSSGSAYIFERDAGGAWLQKPKLTASDAAAGDSFGRSVSISGGYAVVGAYGDDDNGSSSGSAYIFERDGGGVWSQTPKLTASDGAGSDLFGMSVSISGDYAIVGARGDADNGYESGSAYIFERDATGAWLQTPKLTASDGANYDRFGSSVSINGDYALVGGAGSNSAYLFERDASGVWAQCTAKLSSFDWAGPSSVSLSGDNAFVGSEWTGGAKGAAYIYENASTAAVMYECAWTNESGGSFNDSANWSETGVLPSTGPDVDTYVVFGDDPDPIDAPSGPVVLAQDTEVHGLGLDTSSRITLDLAGHDLTIPDDPGAPSGIITFQPGSLRLVNSQPAQSVFTVHGIDVSKGRLNMDIGQGVTFNVVVDGFTSVGAPNLFLNGGTLAAANGVYFGGAENLTGYGEVLAPVAASHGSVIRATGDLALGDASAYDGFFSDGRLFAGSHTVTINDRNVAVLGSLTELGDGASGGTLTAGNANPADTHAHFLLEQGKNMVGRGSVNGNYKNHGDVVGDGTAEGERLVFNIPWTVSGKGTFTNTMIVGTFAPGDSPTIAQGANQGFGGTVEIELGGTTPGSGSDNHDQINDTATVLLSGSPTLEILPWNSFVPEVGDQFVILTWDEALVGTFGNMTVDPWFTDRGLDFELHYNDVASAGNLTIEATPEPATLSLLALGGLAMIRRKRRQA